MKNTKVKLNLQKTAGSSVVKRWSFLCKCDVWIVNYNLSQNTLYMQQMVITVQLTAFEFDPSQHTIVCLTVQRVSVWSCDCITAELLELFSFIVTVNAHLHRSLQAPTNCTQDPSNVRLQTSWTAHERTPQSDTPWTLSLQKNDSAPCPVHSTRQRDTNKTTHDNN